MIIMFKKLLIAIGKLFGLTWYDSIDVRCPKCGKKAIITSDVIETEALDQLSGEKFDRFVYSINCPKCGCAGALTEIWEQEIHADKKGDQPVKLVVHKSNTSSEEAKKRLKDEKDEIIEEVREQMKDLGATDEEIEKMVEDLIRQLEDAIITDDEDID